MVKEDLDILRIELILNTRRVDRALNLILVAEKMEKYVKALGGAKAVAEAIAISERMVHLFLSVLNLPDEVKEFFRTRKIDSLDVGYRLTLLDNREDQVFLAGKIIEDEFTSKDLREIVSIKRSNRSTNIKAVIKEFNKVRKITRFRFIIPATRFKSLIKSAHPNKLIDEIRKKIKKKLGPGTLHDATINEGYASIVFTEKGFRKLTKEARAEALNKKETIVRLINV